MIRIGRLSSILLLSSVYCSAKKQTPFEFIDSIQFRANNPIEDRIAIAKIDSYPGYMVSVFDGHGGDLVAEYASKNISQILSKRLSINSKLNLQEKQLFEKSLTETYDDIENQFFEIFKSNIKDKAYQRVGACALTAIILKNNIFVANAGDCEGVILSQSKAVKTNTRLNAGEPQQKERLRKLFPNEPDIIKCIDNTNYCYVKGRLQPTRSLADYYLKSPVYNFTKLSTFTGPYITHTPLLTHFKITPQDKYLVLGTDGLWDELSDSQIHQNLIKNKVPKDKTPSEVLLDRALQKVCQNNNLKKEQLVLIENRRDIHDDISIVTVNLTKLVDSLK